MNGVFFLWDKCRQIYQPHWEFGYRFIWFDRVFMSEFFWNLSLGWGVLTSSTFTLCLCILASDLLIFYLGKNGRQPKTWAARLLDLADFFYVYRGYTRDPPSFGKIVQTSKILGQTRLLYNNPFTNIPQITTNLSYLYCTAISAFCYISVDDR